MPIHNIHNKIMTYQINTSRTTFDLNMTTNPHLTYNMIKQKQKTTCHLHDIKLSMLPLKQLGNIACLNIKKVTLDPSKTYLDRKTS